MKMNAATVLLLFLTIFILAIAFSSSYGIAAVTGIAKSVTDMVVSVPDLAMASLRSFGRNGSAAVPESTTPVPANGTSGLANGPTPVLSPKAAATTKIPAPAATSPKPTAAAPTMPTLQPTKTSPDDPYIDNFRFELWNTTISDCEMRQFFPEIGNNSRYGLRASPPYLTGLPVSRVNAYVEHFEDGDVVGYTAAVPEKCRDIIKNQDTTWNFVAVDALFTPKNARPSPYQVILSIRSNGRLVTQIISNQTLTPGKSAGLDIVIPMRGNETISMISLNFNRLSTA